MSINPLLTHVSPTTSLYAALGSGGGGGGGGSVSTIVMSNGVITGVSTIGGVGAPQVLRVDGELWVYSAGLSNENVGFEVYQGGGNTTVAQADFDSGAGGQGAIGARGYSTIAGNQVIDTIFTLRTDNQRNGIISMNHEFAGVSTMGQITIQANGGNMVFQALPAAFGGAGSGLTISGYQSTVTVQPQNAELAHVYVPVSTTTYVPATGATQELGAFTTIAGNVYDVRLQVRYDTTGVPAAGDWAVLTCDAANTKSFDTIDCVQVSTLQQQYEKSICGTFVASAATTKLIALGRLTAAVSTSITVSQPSGMWVRNLGVPS